MSYSPFPVARDDGSHFIASRPLSARAERSSGRWAIVGLLLLTLFVALVLGAGTAIVGPMMAFLGVGLFAVALSFALPLQWLLLIDLFAATIVAGSVEYFAGLGQSHWIPYLLGPLLAIRALMERRRATSEPGDYSKRNVAPWFKAPAVLYGALLVGSTVINLTPGFQVITGLKNFVFMWGVLFAFLAIADWQKTSRLVWMAIVVISCLQLPVAAYQRFFIASKATSVAPWDSVVGTFGGIPMVGGHSASMTLFICAGFVWLLLAWRDGGLSIGRVFSYIALALSAVVLAEVKAVVIWLALGTGLVFLRLARARPLVFIGGTLLNVVLVLIVMFAYVTFYYSGGATRNLEDIYEKQVAYVYDTHKFNPTTREMGRVASVIFWGQQQELSDPTSTLIGNGIGSSRGLSTFGPGVVAKRYSFFIDTSALAVLLWDVGLLGAAAFIGTLLLGAFQGLSLAKDPRLPPDIRRMAEASGIVLFLVLVGVPYTRDAVDDSSIQFLLFFCLACVARAAAARRPGHAGADVPT